MCPLPTTYYLTTYYLLPTTYYLLPTLTYFITARDRASWWAEGRCPARLSCAPLSASCRMLTRRRPAWGAAPPRSCSSCKARRTIVSIVIDGQAMLVLAP